MGYYSCSLKFVLDERTLKNGLTPVYARLICNRKKTEIALHELVDPKRWSRDIGRIIKPKNSYEQYLNQKLNRIENQLNTHRLYLESINEEVSGKRIKELFTGRDDRNKISLLDFFATYIQEITIKKEHSPGVLRHYKQNREKLECYLKSIGAEGLLLEHLSLKHILGYETYLMTTPSAVTKKQRGRATVNTYMKKFKAVVGHALRRELIKNNPFAQFKMHRVQSNRQALTSDELAALEKYDFSYDKALQNTQMTFIFLVYTALRFSDAMALTESNLVTDAQSGRTFIHTVQLKTKQPVTIPILLPARRVLDSFAPQRVTNGGKLLFQISNQRCNSRLKEIQGILKIKTPLSTHVARHTAATVVLLDNNVDIKTVSSWLGHESYKSSENYARTSKRKLLKVAEQVEAAYLKQNSESE